MRTFRHVGIPTSEKKEDAGYNEGLGVWITDPDSSPNKIEFLKFEGFYLPSGIDSEHGSYRLSGTLPGNCTGRCKCNFRTLCV